MNTASVVPLVPRIQPSLADACALLDSAKIAEAEATIRRLAAENAVIALMGELPDEGTTRADAGEFTAIVTTAMRRSVDSERLTEIAAQIPEAIGKRLIKWKPELITRELRFIQSNEPEIYSIVALAIEAKPAKPSVKIERAKGGEAA